MSYIIDADYLQQFLLPRSLEDWVTPDHPARFIRDFVDSLDLEELGFILCKGKDGRPPFADSLKLKIWVYGYFEKVRSTRQLEKACQNHVGFMWLTGLHALDHNTIWEFFKKNKKAMRRIFRKVTLTALKANLIGYTLHALDGTKIQAKVSNRTGWSIEELKAQLKEIEKHISKVMKEIELTYSMEQYNHKLPKELQEPEDRKKKIQQAIDEVSEIERKYIHFEDKEARMMKCDRVHNFAFNPQVVADKDSGLIVAEDVTNDENDTQQLVPMIEEVENNLGKIADENVADGGYYSPEQITKADEKDINYLVNMKEASTERKYYKWNFNYNEKKDVFICPEGKELTFERIKDEPRHRYKVRVYRCHHKNCPKRHLCTREKRGRSIEKEPHYELKLQQIQKQKLPENKNLLKQRKSIVEPVFGIIKEAYRFRRFTLNGLENVKTQWSLVCTSYNLNKLFKFWKEKKLVFS